MSRNLTRRREIKVESLDAYILPLTGKPKQQRFTKWLLNDISSRQGSAISGCPLLEPTDFGSAVCS